MNVTDLFENKEKETALILSCISGSVERSASLVLNTEHNLTLYGENALLHRFVCSPSSLGELCAGWLLTEGYRANSVEVSQDGHTATAQPFSPFPSEPERLSLSSPVNAHITEMLELFHQASDEHARSHGIHECVIKGDGWHILRTDIGRHNAIDKAVGAVVLAGYDLTGAVMFTSGRINVQTVKKAARCKIGCLMSKAVITCEALTLAEELGLKVLFSVNENSYVTK